MKTCSAELQAHMEQEDATLALILRLERRDGTVMGFTDLDVDIPDYGGVLYESGAGGFIDSVISASSDFSTDNLELKGYIDSAKITREDLLSKKYDGANLSLAIVNYEDLTMGDMPLPGGFFGPVKYEDGQFAVELLGRTKALSQARGLTIEKYCIWKFCDENCGLVAADYTVEGRVTAVDSLTARRWFRDSSRSEAVDWFRYGSLTWLTGNNAGYQVEIANFLATSLFELFEVMPYPVAVGDIYEALGGCDWLDSTCKTKWGDSNIVHFGGLGLFLPGQGGLLDYPDRT